MINSCGLSVVKIDDEGDAIIKSELSHFRVSFDYDVDVISESVKFFVNINEIQVLINDDYSIFIELSKFDKHFLKALSLAIIEHMENQ